MTEYDYQETRCRTSSSNLCGPPNCKLSLYEKSFFWSAPDLLSDLRLGDGQRRMWHTQGVQSFSLQLGEPKTKICFSGRLSGVKERSGCEIPLLVDDYNGLYYQYHGMREGF